MGVVVDPFARCRNPLACGDDGCVADHRDQLAMATGLYPQNAETIVAIMEGDTLDKGRQYFLGRWFLRWPHRCCFWWLQSQPSGLDGRDRNCWRKAFDGDSVGLEASTATES